MTVSEARESARQWVCEHAAPLPGFCGAYTAGSTNWLAAEAEMPAASDLDMMVVVAGGNMAGARQRFVHGGALLEVSYLRNAPFQFGPQSSHRANPLRSPEPFDTSARSTN